MLGEDFPQRPEGADHTCIVKIVREDGEIETDILVDGDPPAPGILSEFHNSLVYAGFGGFGPFVAGSLSGDDGVSVVSFRLPGAVAGERYTVTIEVVGLAVDPAQFDPGLPFLADDSVFVFPGTATGNRDSGEIVLP